jgi:hypothetical protein
MRVLPLAAATLLTLALCSSAADKSTINVYVADELYAGCMYSTVQAHHIDADIPAVDAFIAQADENCITWMVLWYRVLLPNERHIDQLTKPELDILNARRTLLLKQIQDTLYKAIK